MPEDQKGYTDIAQETMAKLNMAGIPRDKMAFAVFRGSRGRHVAVLVDITGQLFNGDWHMVGVKGEIKDG